MRAPYSLSYLFLLSLGACVPLRERQEPGDPGEGTLLSPSWRTATAAEDSGAGWRAGAKRRRSEELSTLLGITRELRSYGKEGTALGNLAEELNGYNRRKGGFTFRFGR
ncbi:PREDICTED: orexigenic neuropeptide QRFP [Cariama cristata]|uniref:orexigenic neuropeptide QRFP n=1 Tax=Cariama cristata TaxID=54380 RepID=UPI000520938D|nr:PREDICTED: orexigenic neuropeptide QRFP [Cariama cristata]